MRRYLLAALLALAPLSAAGAQGTPEQRIQAARRQAEQSGIPVSLLDGKVAEGRAKGVPMDRIVAAVERRLQSLERARQAMAGGGRVALRAEDLAVGADALEEGVEPRALGRLAAAAPADRRAMAIAVLTQLVSGGMASERALEQVTARLDDGPEALRRLPGEAAETRGRRGPPEGRGQGSQPGARGRGRGNAQGGGPPASVPGPKKPKDNRPDRP